MCLVGGAMTDDELIAAAAPLLRALLERGLLRGRLNADTDTFTLLVAEPSDERLADELRSLPPLPHFTNDTKH